MPEQKLYLLSAWREVNIYTERERAAMGWAEAVNSNNIPPEIFEEAKKQFSDEELIDLTLAVAAVGTWNKLNLAFAPLEAGTYQVGQFA
jgi:alkylhydroperoxidase family enzyme